MCFPFAHFMAFWSVCVIHCRFTKGKEKNTNSMQLQGRGKPRWFCLKNCLNSQPHTDQRRAQLAVWMLELRHWELLQVILAFGFHCMGKQYWNNSVAIAGNRDTMSWKHKAFRVYCASFPTLTALWAVREKCVKNLICTKCLFNLKLP